MGTQKDLSTIRKILDLAQSSAVDIKTAEMNYKCLVRWYATPDRTSKYQKGKLADCWRGCKEVGTMAHLWWKCPIIQKYWEKILAIIKEITKTEVKEDP